MNEEDKLSTEELAVEIERHKKGALESFKAGQETHRSYVDAPEKRNLTDEIEQFAYQLQAGIKEMDEAIGLQKEYLDRAD